MGATGIQLQADIEIQLDNLARKLGRSKHYLINQAVNEFVASHVAELRRANTLQPPAAAGNGELINATAVIAWLENGGTTEA
jgi:predicted transcriptional regulator